MILPKAKSKTLPVGIIITLNNNKCVQPAQQSVPFEFSPKWLSLGIYIFGVHFLKAYKIKN